MATTRRRTTKDPLASRRLDVARLDRRHVGRSAPAQPLEVVRAEGSHVVAADGTRYVDFAMGWCVGNLGWAREELRERLAAFRGPEYVLPGQRYAPWAELAAGLAAVAPGRLTTAWRATGGTEAVELALQAAMAATGRRRLVSLEGAYHGNSFGAKSVGAMRGSLGVALPGCRTIAPPFDEARLERVETLLRKDDVAAVILEPIPTALGVVVPEPAFMTGLQRLCRRHGTLLILDEVATGFGRTGALFAAEHYGLAPDLLCLAKGITGGAGALGATLVTDAVQRRLRGRFDFYSTFGWHPVAVEAALANLAVWRARGDALLANVAARSREAEDRLRGLDTDAIAEVRVKGLAIGLEVDDPESLVERCRAEGLLVSGEDDVLYLFPALDVDQATLADGLDRLERALG